MRTTTNMTMRGKENSRRIDLIEDRTTHDQLVERDAETTLEMRHEAYIERNGVKHMTKVH